MNTDFAAAAGRLLDEAIAETFRLRKERLAADRGLNTWGTSQALTAAAAEIDSKLRGLQSPNYQDDAVALVYLLSHHFSHVNLAWSMLAASDIENRLSAESPSPNLQIVDVGAGTFAMLFGATLFSAERVQAGNQPLKIDVTSFEPAYAMRSMGDATWDSFRRLAGDEARDEASLLAPLQIALQQVTHRHDPAHFGSVAVQTDAHRCLTAMHAIYRNSDQRLSLRSELTTLHQGLAPHSGFLTCYVGHREQAMVLSPFRHLRLELVPQPKIEAEPVLTRVAGNRAGVKRTSQYTTPPQLAYATWSKHLDETSVLYWSHDA